MTLLFTDIEGSTRLLHLLGDAYGAVLAEHRRLLRETWAEFGGTEVDTEGDAFFVAFGDAGRAVAAAVTAQGRLAAHPWPGGEGVRVRMGLHTGTPSIQDGGYWGEDVHYAARLASAAHGGQILLSDSTRSLAGAQPVESLGEHAVKDFPSPREIFHVVVEGVRSEAFPPPRTYGRTRSNLPVRANVLIGRAAEVADLLRRVETEQLITVTGPGGVGKTRLLLELGHEVREQFEQVWFVPAEQCSVPGALFAATVRAIGLAYDQGDDDVSRIADYVARRRVLLLLDNLEQVLDAGPAIARIATAGPDVRVAASSQTPLRVAAERVVRLGPLPAPDGAEHAAEAVAASPAVALLLQRAAALGSSFVLTDANAAEVGRLCAQLEGMPLALELAAARLDLLTPEALSGRLEQSLDALGKGARDLPARQRGLRAMLEWTCGLLSDDERTLLAQLSVFSGGFTAELAEAAFGDCVDELAALVDVCLVIRTDSGRLMCRPPVRRFAAELLAAEGDAMAANAAVCDALAAIAEPFATVWFFHERTAENRRTLNPEGDNIMASLRWAAPADAARHTRLAAAVAWWMAHANLATFGREHLELALSRTEDPVQRATCLQGLGWLVGFAISDPAGCLTAAQAWHDLGDALGEAASLAYAANLYSHARNGEQALATAIRAQEVARAVPDEGLQWLVETTYAQALNDIGRHDEAIAALRPHLDNAGGSWRRGMTATLLADAFLAAGRPAEALPLYGQVMKVLGEDVGSRVGELVQADTAVLALAQLGRLDDAAIGVAVCDLAHAELAWPAPGAIGQALETARGLVSDEQLAAGRRHARALGVASGLSWVGKVARGEPV